MWEWLGYCALGISLLSVNMTRIKPFRWLHLLASSLYMIYGFLIQAFPIMVGGASL